MNRSRSQRTGAGARAGPAPAGRRAGTDHRGHTAALIVPRALRRGTAGTASCVNGSHGSAELPVHAELAERQRDQPGAGPAPSTVTRIRARARGPGASNRTRVPRSHGHRQARSSRPPTAPPTGPPRGRRVATRNIPRLRVLQVEQLGAVGQVADPDRGGQRGAEHDADEDVHQRLHHPPERLRQDHVAAATGEGNPSERAASACPTGTVLMPPRTASQTNAAPKAPGRAPPR